MKDIVVVLHAGLAEDELERTPAGDPVSVDRHNEWMSQAARMAWEKQHHETLSASSVSLHVQGRALAVMDLAERKALNHAVDAQPPTVRMNPLQQSLRQLSRQTTWSILILALAGVLLAGCGSASARVRGVAPLNLNDNNESTPVDVRFFQLADDGAFRRVTFDALWVDAGKALGGDLVAAPVVKTVFPGSRSDQPTLIQLGKLSGKTKFIGVMGLYRRTDGTDRRTLVLALDRIEKDVIELSGYSVSLSTEGTPAEGGKGASNQPAAPTKSASGGG